MTADDLSRLLELHRAAMEAQEIALRDGTKWPSAGAADDAFRNALLTMTTNHTEKDSRAAGKQNARALSTNP